jgi:polyferredoxin
LGRFLNRIKISRRRVIQLISAVIYNSNFAGFAGGTIYQGNIKGVCVPGLNCYSCPGAIGSCPLGSLQLALGELKFKLPLYIAGTLLIFGVTLGRAVCAFLCPFGLIQELLYKIPSPKIKKSSWTRRLSWLKYVILALFVVTLPIYYLIRHNVAVPAFCKYICPAGTLTAGVPLVAMNGSLQDIIGALFYWKISVLAVILIMSVFIYRPFCRFLCPLGAIYSFFNRYALTGIAVDKSKCSKCSNCIKSCKMDVKSINDRECLRCGECKKSCRNNAIIFTPKNINRTSKENRNEK